MITRIRAAGIIIHNEQVLLHRVEDFWVLPGGAVEFETSRNGLKREFDEELGIEVTIGPLVWVAENFFKYYEEKEQSIEFYYRVDLPPNSELYDRQAFEGYEHTGDEKLEFQWHKLDQLHKVKTLPEFLEANLKQLKADGENEIKHIINKKI